MSNAIKDMNLNVKPSRRHLLCGTAIFAFGGVGAFSRYGAQALEVNARGYEPLLLKGDRVFWRNAPHRDLPLSDWGAYSDHLNGISHISDVGRGLRMDFALAPAILRRETLIPYAQMGLAMQPVRADPNLGYISWEYKLDSGVDILLEWIALNEMGGVLRATAHNKSETAWPLIFNWMARLAAPNNPPHSRYEEGSKIPHTSVKGAPSKPAVISLPPLAQWVNGLHYEHFSWGKGRFDDHLVTDGRKRAEVFEDGFVDHVGVGQGFGQTLGDQVQWRFVLAHSLKDAVIRFRYRMIKGVSDFKLNGLFTARLKFENVTDDTGFRTVDISVGDLAARTHALSLTAFGGAPIELNGFVVCAKSDLEKVAFAPHIWQLKPKRHDEVATNQTRLSFEGETKLAYAMAWTGGTSYIHEAQTDDVRTLDWALNDPSLFQMGRQPKTQDVGFITFAVPDIIDLAARQTVVRDCFVAVGEGEKATQNLKLIRSLDYEARFLAARTSFKLATDPFASKHQEGAQRLLASISTNLLFPIWTGGQWVRNYCPGREWASVYTWDSGFTGLGLSRSAPRLATAMLDTYLSPLNDDQAAFLHHGTPLPTQFYLFQELWNRNGDVEFAKARYGKLARYLRFLLGRETGSTMRDLKSGLIRTYDYFYNTGGMDDYPAQMAVHSQKKTKHVAPVITSAHAIRCAKILLQVAKAIGANHDFKEWQADIDNLSHALQTYSWDEESGYFAYVVHDDSKNPIGKWQSEAGENFNMGLDGVSPLVSDICNPQQLQTLIDNVMNKGRLWTPSGITAVDQRASYYDKAGYWNGTVWMPHQWFMWKSMFDYAQGDKAWLIAKTALEVYSAEIARSGRAYENFDAQTGIGSAWHPFGALSSPVRHWFEAYAQAATLSVGLNCHVVKQKWDNKGVKAVLDISGDRAMTVLATLDHEPTKATWRGKLVDITLRADRCAEVVLTAGQGELEIS